MATTADILGLKKRSKIPAQWLDHHQRLCSERDTLVSRAVDKVVEAAPSPKMDDLSDAGAEESQTNISVVTAGATQARIGEVIDAIARIENGGYGICEISGEEIEADRLHAIPWARYSFRGQVQLEQSSRAPRLAVGPLESMADLDAGENEEGEPKEER